jgi:hypothetical protein
LARIAPLERSRAAALLAAALFRLVALPALARASDAATNVHLQPAAPDTAAPLPEGQLVVRHTLNPNYRPPASRVPAAHFVAPRQNGFDHLYAQLSGRGLGSEATTGDAHFVLERMFKDTDRITTQVDGALRQGFWSGREMRLEARKGPWLGDLGDLLAFAPVPELDFHSARGLFAGRDLGQGAALSLIAGQPSPWATGDGAQFLALTGQELRNEATRITAVASGFRWASGRHDGESAWAASLGQRSPFGGGVFGTSFALQRHDLTGRAVSAAALGFEWRMLRPTYAFTVRERRASDGIRILTDEQADLAPRDETAADLQTRFWHSRAEMHSSITRFVGGDSTRNWQSTQFGGSSQLGASPWYAGGHASWDLPGASPEIVRQIGAYLGRSGGASAPLLLRVQQTFSVGAPAAWELSGEMSVAIGGGSRMALEPMAEWRAQHLDRAGVTLGGNRALPWPGSRVTLRLRVDSDRTRAYRLGLSEASVAFTLRPRPRDTWQVEMRQGLDVSGYELTSTYDLQQPRYVGAEAVARRRGASDVVVRVERNDGTGAEGVLVSLDNKDLRFTDANGEAVFESVTPGMHELSLEERTLPESWHITGPTRQMLSIERDVAPSITRFKIARLEKRSKF